jgi:hypothetical protein
LSRSEDSLHLSESGKFYIKITQPHKSLAETVLVFLLGLCTNAKEISLWFKSTVFLTSQASFPLPPAQTISFIIVSLPYFDWHSEKATKREETHFSRNKQ